MASTRTIIVAVLALAAAGASAQARRDVPYVATSPAAVQQMIELARLRDGDVVYDLGCGDGRIVIAAVKVPGVRGVCVEIDPALVRLARDEADKAGVSSKITFVQGDIFEVPIQDATVVMLYLLREVNLRLRPRLWKELRPGTRVVSNTFDMGDWEPERQVAVPPGSTTIYSWTISAARK
jgi:SAM-dependent methyltransferase